MTSTSTQDEKRELRIGDRIKDNDVRQGRRVLRITRLTDRFAFAISPSGMEVRIQRVRIFTDAKARKSGFSLERSL